MTKTIIEQADEIAGVHHPLIDFNINGKKLSADTYRRGAYAKWFAENSSPDMWPSVAEVLDSQAERIVRLHAASKPKGDGLPEGMWVTSCDTGKYGLSVEVCATRMSRAERCALHEYIACCLTDPVRRFLAAFECFEPTSDEKCSGEAFVVTTTTAACVAGQNGPVCWLKPREAK